MIPEPCEGELVIGSTEMFGFGWYMLDLLDLWMGPAHRGQDRVLPLADGVVPHLRRPDVTRHSLPMVIMGETDPSGDPYPNLWVGLETNVGLLRAQVGDPTGVGDGTRAATLQMPSGAVRNASVHSGPIIRGRTVAGTNLLTGNPGIGMLATLELSIPAGAFA